MDYCEMTGCFDGVEYRAEFEANEERIDTVLWICESCADFWRKDKDENPKITPLRKRETAGQK